VERHLYGEACVTRCGSPEAASLCAVPVRRWVDRAIHRGGTGEIAGILDDQTQAPLICFSVAVRILASTDSVEISRFKTYSTVATALPL
jgi:hypothetical protein